MPFELSEETRRLLDFLSQQRALEQQDPTQDPMAVLGTMQTAPDERQAPTPAPAPAEATSVNISPAMDELRRQIQQQVDAGFSRQAPPQQSSDEIVASAINQAFPQQQAQPTPQTQSAPSQQAPARQEQASGTDLVNRAVESAIPQSASRLLPPAPNTVQHNYRQQIIATKLLYDEAERKYNAAQTPEDKQAALVEMQSLNQRANDLRGIANETGVDLNGYGEGVTLRDAQRNLESQQAKDFMQMYTGRYSMTSDQFYESEYDRQIMRGRSDYEARLSAARATREYKAKRVAYLNGMYNNYGLTNGQVTNQLGMQILSELAGEDPNRTNAYGTAYALPKDEYKNANEMAKLAMSEKGAWDRLIESARQNLIYADHQALIRGEERQEEAANQRAYAYVNAEIKQRSKDIEFRTKNKQLNDLADTFNLTGADRVRFIAKGHGIDVPDDKKSDDKALKSAGDYLSKLEAEAKRHQETLSSPNASEEDKTTARTKLVEVQDRIDSLNAQISEVYGINPPTYEKYSGDEQKDIQSVRTILAFIQSKSNGALTPQAVREAMRDWANENEAGKKLTDAELDALVLKAINAGGDK